MINKVETKVTKSMFDFKNLTNKVKYKMLIMFYAVISAISTSPVFAADDSIGDSLKSFVKPLTDNYSTIVLVMGGTAILLIGLMYALKLEDVAKKWIVGIVIGIGIVLIGIPILNTLATVIQDRASSITD